MESISYKFDFTVGVVEEQLKLTNNNNNNKQRSIMNPDIIYTLVFSAMSSDQKQLRRISCCPRISTSFF